MLLARQTRQASGVGASLIQRLTLMLVKRTVTQSYASCTTYVSSDTRLYREPARTRSGVLRSARLRSGSVICARKGGCGTHVLEIEL